MTLRIKLKIIRDIFIYGCYLIKNKTKDMLNNKPYFGEGTTFKEVLRETMAEDNAEYKRFKELRREVYEKAIAQDIDQ